MLKQNDCRLCQSPCGVLFTVFASVFLVLPTRTLGHPIVSENLVSREGHILKTLSQLVSSLVLTVNLT